MLVSKGVCILWLILILNELFNNVVFVNVISDLTILLFDVLLQIIQIYDNTINVMKNALNIARKTLTLKLFWISFKPDLKVNKRKTLQYNHNS